MIRFECDYAEGACPEIIKKLERIWRWERWHL